MLINSPETHEIALKKLSELEDNYEENKIEFGILFDLIYEYEETCPELDQKKDGEILEFIITLLKSHE